MIKEWRKQIDEIDKNLIMLIAKRLSFVRKISSYKKKHRMKIFDRKREKEVINNMVKEAKKLDINKKFTEEIFRKIIKEARRTEKCKK